MQPSRQLFFKGAGYRTVYCMNIRRITFATKIPACRMYAYMQNIIFDPDWTHMKHVRRTGRNKSRRFCLGKCASGTAQLLVPVDTKQSNDHSCAEKRISASNLLVASHYYLHHVSKRSGCHHGNLCESRTRTSLHHWEWKLGKRHCQNSGKQLPPIGIL